VCTTRVLVLAGTTFRRGSWRERLGINLPYISTRLHGDTQTADDWVQPFVGG
jgi:hypothetical protein